jgi:hypothetical protein
MKQGVLWFDDSRVDFCEKIDQAVDYVQKKYGRMPRLCFVHPSMLQNNINLANGLKIRPSSTVMPNHFWFELVL